MSDFPYRIVFIRHGETEWNADGRLQGQQNIPLNGKGREQAIAVGRGLVKHMRAEIDALEAANAFVASPLDRVQETMRLARAAMGLPPDRFALDAELKELTFGTWEGLTWAEVAAADPAGARARETDKWDFTPPRGESYAALSVRISGWLARQRADVFVAAHGGVCRALMHIIAGLDPQSVASAPIHQGRAIVFEDGRFKWVG